MLRLLHTADWHLGKTLRGYSREEEHRAALSQLVAMAEVQQPDALLVAGDVFDSPNPPAEAQQLYYQTLLRLHQVCPDMTIVVTAGNHDAAARLEAPREVLGAIGVHVVGNVRRQHGVTATDRHLVAVRNREGTVLGHVLAVSYPTAACLPAVPVEGEGSRVVRATRELYQGLAEATREQWQGLPLVVMGHLHVQGGEESEGSERRILVGGENAVPANVFPSEAGYVALGHLHKPQRVGGGERVRYSGSLFPLSASEASYEHGVNLVEIDGAQLHVEKLKLERTVAFVRVGYVPFARVATELSAVGNLERPPFVQVCLEREGLPVTYREQLDALAEESGVRLVETRLREVTGVQVMAPSTQVADHDPEHFFELAFERALERKPEEKHRALFQQAVEGV